MILKETNASVTGNKILANEEYYIPGCDFLLALI